MLLFEKDGIQIYTDDIEQAIIDICYSINVKPEDIINISQRQFKYILSQIGKRLFPDKLIKNTYSTTLQRPIYEIDNNIADILCNYYIDLCNKYNKLISLDGYSKLLNMDYDTVCRWKDKEPNSKKKSIHERLFREREKNLEDACFDSTGAIGKIAVANHLYNWDNKQSFQPVTINVLSADTLPVLSLPSEQN